MILAPHRTTRFRGGFTLVELMVAAALAITIMWILAESFKMGIDFARSARSTGDMMTQLNNAGQIMNRDLSANHFYVSQSGLTGNLGKLSAQRLDYLGGPAFEGSQPSTNSPNGAVASAGGYLPPAGYFRIVSPLPSTSLLDNSEGFSINTANPNSSLSFTVYLPQGLPQNVFTATSTTGYTYSSQAAEVCYFIGSPLGQGQPVGMTVPDSLTSTQVNQLQTQLQSQGYSPTQIAAQIAGMQQGQPLYNLYRQQRLVAPTTDYVSSLSPTLTTESPTTIADILSITTLPATPPATGTVQQVNTLASFNTVYAVNNQPHETQCLFGTHKVPKVMTPLQTHGRIGDDIVLSNVLSFEVLATWMTPSGYPLVVQPNSNNSAPVGGTVPLLTPLPTPFAQNSNYPFDHLPLLKINTNTALQYTFDTWFTFPKRQFYRYPINTRGNMLANWNWNNFYMLNNPGPLPDNAKNPLQNLANPNLIPMPLRITGLQITIRIYDPKTKQARQNTWRLAM